MSYYSGAPSPPAPAPVSDIRSLPAPASISASSIHAPPTVPLPASAVSAPATCPLSPLAAPAGPGQGTPTLNTPLTRDFPALGRLSRAELEELLAEPPDAEDSLFEAYVLTLPDVQARLEQHDALLQSIESKARKNEAEQAPLEALRRDTERQLALAQQADQTWLRQLEPALQEAYRQFTPGALHAKMVQGTTRIWDQSEALANVYVEGLPLSPDMPTTPPDTQQFLRLFQELRTRYHRRALFAERWGQGTVAWPA